MNRFEVPDWAWPEGHRIGSFELQAVASCGDDGIVYRAWDFALARAVAVKEYLPTGIARRNPRGDVHPVEPEDTEAFARGRRAFVAGCQTLARCDHPSLARVLHLTEAHGTTYCVMPWYSARSLLEVRPKIGHPVNEALLRSLLEDFLGALEAYHRVGGMHGGLSPSKVLLLDDDRGLLLGPSATGHATRLASHDATSQPSDTAFASVEQRTAEVNAQPQGPWTDFYTLAAIVRFWITGLLPPVPGRGPPEPLAATIGRQFVGQPVMPYSEGLLRALDAAMSVDINKRPQSAAQFRRWLAQSPSQAAATQGRGGAGLFDALIAVAARVVAGAWRLARCRHTECPGQNGCHRGSRGRGGRCRDGGCHSAHDCFDSRCARPCSPPAWTRRAADKPRATAHCGGRRGSIGCVRNAGSTHTAAGRVRASACLMAAAALVAIVAWQVMPWLSNGVQSDQTLSHAPPVEPADDAGRLAARAKRTSGFIDHSARGAGCTLRCFATGGHGARRQSRPNRMQHRHRAHLSRRYRPPPAGRRNSWPAARARCAAHVPSFRCTDACSSNAARPGGSGIPSACI